LDDSFRKKKKLIMTVAEFKQLLHRTEFEIPFSEKSLIYKVEHMASAIFGQVCKITIPPTQEKLLVNGLSGFYPLGSTVIYLLISQGIKIALKPKSWI